MPTSPDPISQIQHDEAILTFRFSAIVQEARKISEELDPLVEKWELRSSEFLMGTAGALSFSLVAFFIMYLIGSSAAVTFVVTTVSLIIGSLIPLLLFRGSSQWKVEKNIRRMRITMRALRAEIQELDEIQNVPQQIKEGIWAAYVEALSSFRRAEKALQRRESRGKDETVTSTPPKS